MNYNNYFLDFYIFLAFLDFLADFLETFLDLREAFLEVFLDFLEYIFDN